MKPHLTTDQARFIAAAKAGKNIFLTGKAGTGKSFIVDYFISHTKKPVAKLGTTGVAAANIGGQTVHSFFGINPYKVYNGRNAQFLSRPKRDVINKAEIIIIDEVSMMRPDVLDAINGTMMFNGCGYLSDKQVIFVGDLKQLPVVQAGREQHIINEIYGGHVFNMAKTYPYLRVEEIELTEIKRQSDQRFIEALNEIREGRKDEYFRQFSGESPNNGVILAPHTATVDRYNTEKLNELEGDLITFRATVEGQINPKDYRVDTEIHVKNGAKIMYCINNKTAGLVNGDIGHFFAEDGKFFFVKNGYSTEIKRHTFENQKYVVEEKRKEGKNGKVIYTEELTLKKVGEMSQYPIKLAYALSIHKSQGMTFDEVTVDLKRRCFVPGQLYVALSRVRTPEGLRIIV